MQETQVLSNFILTNQQSVWWGLWRVLTCFHWLFALPTFVNVRVAKCHYQTGVDILDSSTVTSYASASSSLISFVGIVVRLNPMHIGHKPRRYCWKWRPTATVLWPASSDRICKDASRVIIRACKMRSWVGQFSIFILSLSSSLAYPHGQAAQQQN